MMKKLVSGLCIATALLAVGTTSAFAAKNPNAPAWCSTKQACAFVDADGDGICDYYNAKQHAWIDADGDGICDTCRRTLAVDWDGVCDHTRMHAHNGTGKQNGRCR